MAEHRHPDWYNAIYTSQFFAFLVAKGFECDRILDVGANKGYWSAEARKFFPKAQIYMMEPLMEMKPFLEQFVKNDPGSKYIAAAAGSGPGSFEMTIWPSLTGSSFLPPPGYRFYDKFEKRTVPIMTIDDLIEQGEIDVPTLAKFDVQGFELEALKGGEKLFGKTEVFILEVSLVKVLSPDHPVLGDVLGFMADRGYAVYDIIGFYRRRVDHALAALDVCFVKGDSSLRSAKPLIKQHDWDWGDFSSDRA